jgi:hypothetical protein
MESPMQVTRILAALTRATRTIKRTTKLKIIATVFLKMDWFNLAMPFQQQLAAAAAAASSFIP